MDLDPGPASDMYDADALIADPCSLKSLISGGPMLALARGTTRPLVCCVRLRL